MRMLTYIVTYSSLALASIAFATTEDAMDQLFSLKGMCKIEGRWMLSIRNNEKGSHLWMSPGQAHGALKLIAFDQKSGEAELSYMQRTFTLQLAKSDSSPLRVIGNSNSSLSEQPYSPIANLSNPLANPQILPSALLASELNSFPEKDEQSNESVIVGAGKSTSSPEVSDESANSESELVQSTTNARTRNYFAPRVNRVESAIPGQNRPKVMPVGM